MKGTTVGEELVELLREEERKRPVVVELCCPKARCAEMVPSSSTAKNVVPKIMVMNSLHQAHTGFCTLYKHLPPLVRPLPFAEHVFEGLALWMAFWFRAQLWILRIQGRKYVCNS